MSADPDKVEAIQDMPDVLLSKKQVRIFLGKIKMQVHERVRCGLRNSNAGMRDSYCVTTLTGDPCNDVVEVVH